MPEEINRILTDHCSDLLFAPTEKFRHILLGEGIFGNKIFLTENTIVNAVLQSWRYKKRKVDVLDELGLIVVITF